MTRRRSMTLISRDAYSTLQDDSRVRHYALAITLSSPVGPDPDLHSSVPEHFS